MVITISDLTKKKSFKKDIDLSFENDKLIFSNEELCFTKPIQVKGYVSSTGDIINLELDIITQLELTCSRCIENFLYPLEIHISEKLSNNLEAEGEDEDITMFSGDEIDITEIVNNSIIMALPIKKLCENDCKGLCQQCGTNLNKTNCHCDDNLIDPRLAKLKDLFSNS